MSDVHTITGQRTEPTPRFVFHHCLFKKHLISLIALLSSVLGHEAVVQVIAHRRPESDLIEGDRLTFSVVDCCGTCEFCQQGLNQKCTKLFKVQSRQGQPWTFSIRFYAHLVWPCETQRWFRIQWLLC
jgi:threonine dehydrogenase-like Zn-dependent dehydrogenase